jgi:hypothetical protein
LPEDSSLKIGIKAVLSNDCESQLRIALDDKILEYPLDVLLYPLDVLLPHLGKGRPCIRLNRCSWIDLSPWTDGIHDLSEAERLGGCPIFPLILSVVFWKL